MITRSSAIAERPARRCVLVEMLSYCCMDYAYRVKELSTGQKTQFYLHTCIWRPCWWWSHRNLVEMFSPKNYSPWTILRHCFLKSYI